MLNTVLIVFFSRYSQACETRRNAAEGIEPKPLFSPWDMVFAMRELDCPDSIEKDRFELITYHLQQAAVYDEDMQDVVDEWIRIMTDRERKQHIIALKKQKTPPKKTKRVSTVK